MFGLKRVFTRDLKGKVGFSAKNKRSMKYLMSLGDMHLDMTS